MVFVDNGDLFFGTASKEPGQATRGIWRIPGAAQAEQQISAPQQVLPGDVFTSVSPGALGQASPTAFLTAGPFAGDLLILDNPSVALGGPHGRVLHATKPNFSTVAVFVSAPPTLTPKRPEGLALDSRGDILVNDFDTSTIFRYGPDGAFKRVFTSLTQPNQLAVGPDDTVYVTNATFRGAILSGDLNVFNPRGMLRATVRPNAFLRGVTVCVSE